MPDSQIIYDTRKQRFYPRYGSPKWTSRSNLLQTGVHSLLVAQKNILHSVKRETKSVYCMLTLDQKGIRQQIFETNLTITRISKLIF
jgi:hypothetical protein